MEVYTRQLDETSALRNFLYRVASEWEWEREVEQQQNWEEQQKKQKKKWKEQKKRGLPILAYAAGERKALGFTFFEPPPEEAVLDGPSWAEVYTSAPQTPPEEAVWDEQYKLPHRWCVDGVKATVDSYGVITVHCEAEDPETMVPVAVETWRAPSHWRLAMVVDPRRLGRGCHFACVYSKAWASGGVVSGKNKGGMQDSGQDVGRHPGNADRCVATSCRRRDPPARERGRRGFLTVRTTTALTAAAHRVPKHALGWVAASPRAGSSRSTYRPRSD